MGVASVAFRWVVAVGTAGASAVGLALALAPRSVPDARTSFGAEIKSVHDYKMEGAIEIAEVVAHGAHDELLLPTSTPSVELASLLRVDTSSFRETGADEVALRRVSQGEPWAFAVAPEAVDRLAPSARIGVFPPGTYELELAGPGPTWGAAHLSIGGTGYERTVILKPVEARLLRIRVEGSAADAATPELWGAGPGPDLPVRARLRPDGGYELPVPAGRSGHVAAISQGAVVGLVAFAPDEAEVVLVRRPAPRGGDHDDAAGTRTLIVLERGGAYVPWFVAPAVIHSVAEGLPVRCIAVSREGDPVSIEGAAVPHRRRVRVRAWRPDAADGLVPARRLRVDAIWRLRLGQATVEVLGSGATTDLDGRASVPIGGEDCELHAHASDAVASLSVPPGEVDEEMALRLAPSLSRVVWVTTPDAVVTVASARSGLTNWVADEAGLIRFDSDAAGPLVLTDWPRKSFLDPDSIEVVSEGCNGAPWPVGADAESVGKAAVSVAPGEPVTSVACVRVGAWTDRWFPGLTPLSNAKFPALDSGSYAVLLRGTDPRVIGLQLVRVSPGPAPW